MKISLIWLALTACSISDSVYVRDFFVKHEKKKSVKFREVCVLVGRIFSAVCIGSLIQAHDKVNATVYKNKKNITEHHIVPSLKESFCPWVHLYDK